MNSSMIECVSAMKVESAGEAVAAVLPPGAGLAPWLQAVTTAIDAASAATQGRRSGFMPAIVAHDSTPRTAPAGDPPLLRPA